MDDLMRAMMENFSGPKGFTSKDIAQLVQTTCGCTVIPFFDECIYGNKTLDFNRYLKLVGMQMGVTWKEVTDLNHKPVADLRVYAFLSEDRRVKLGITDPSGCWGKAGLHTGDIIVAVNKITVKNVYDFRQEIRKGQVGDTVSLEIQRPSGIVKTRVALSAYQRPSVQIAQIKEATLQQQKLREEWMSNW